MNCEHKNMKTLHEQTDNQFSEYMTLVQAEAASEFGVRFLERAA